MHAIMCYFFSESKKKKKGFQKDFQELFSVST